MDKFTCPVCGNELNVTDEGLQKKCDVCNAGLRDGFIVPLCTGFPIKGDIDPRIEEGFYVPAEFYYRALKLIVMLIGIIFLIIFFIIVGLAAFNMIPEDFKTPIIVILLVVYAIIGGAYILLKNLEQVYAEKFPQEEYLNVK